MNFGLSLPFNKTSFGSLSFGITKEFFRRGLNPSIFPIGGTPDASAQKPDQEFFQWIGANCQKSLSDFKRNYPLFKLWHLHNFESPSDKTFLYSFVEGDKPTPFEINIANNHSKVYFSADYTIEKFKEAGAKTIDFLPPFFDADNFSVVNNSNPQKITFGIYGKFEPVRKRHIKTLQTWIKVYGNKPQYCLNLAVANNFLQPQQVHQAIEQAIFQANGGRNVWNINRLYKFLDTNFEYNQLLNNSDVVLALGNEQIGLPEFHSVALGKHAIVLDCNGYSTWSTDKNSVKINPSGKIEAVDNIFFHPNSLFNQGFFFDYSEEDLIEAFRKVEERVKLNRINNNGLKLQESFTVANVVDKILQDML